MSGNRLVAVQNLRTHLPLSSSADLCVVFDAKTLTNYSRNPESSIGLDTCLSIQQTLYQGTGDSKYRPSVLLERMVDAKWLGKKSGKGFYDYD